MYAKSSKIYAKMVPTSMQKQWKKQVWKFDGKSTENMMVSDGAEPRLALYSCVILHIEKIKKKLGQKIDAKIEGHLAPSWELPVALVVPKGSQTEGKLPK